MLLLVQEEQVLILEWYMLKRVTNNWETVGETTFSESALVVDYNANIEQRAYRYRLVSIDSCGREAVSEPHKSMHLVISKQESGLPFLLWNAYEPNAEVTQYLVLKKNSQTMEFDTLDQVPAGSGTVTWSETDVTTKIHLPHIV